MSSEPIIKVEGLSKRYVLRHSQPHTTLRDAIADRARRLARFGGGKQTTEEFWALDDVSFEIKRGDRVGIIGRNGAGKSTLLKVLSRITEPTKGRITLDGRVASLLEVGTGFHPELSGRENITLNGAILGMSRQEIARKFDEIVAFAEVEKFLDTPVKHYSSGMYVRLAFAVAAHLEPEILVVDEVLAVGDAQFQAKCLGKMQDVSTKEGRTVLFVSHNMQAIGELCQRAVLLRAGKVVADTTASEAIALYLKGGGEPDATSMQATIDALPPDPTFKLERITLQQVGTPVHASIENGKPLDISVEYEVKQRATGLRIYVDVCDDMDTMIFRTFHDEDHDGIPTTEPGRYVSSVAIPANLLGPARYRLHVNASIFNQRHCLPGDGVVLSVDVAGTGSYNRAYLGDTFRGKLAPVIPWVTRKAG
ncbi:MAG TPA: polysaccharide ABC transporter ATP-binding protein [Kofleriaceae bacterium]|jgi:lipopolysaccharide transport system ATP-binding protein|nr:polysaccharide ABC transporter ATP-binding protein [Kofleriaceae bacterium]